MPRALGLTVLSALFPGLGFVLGGRRKLGAFILMLGIGLLLIGAYVGLTQCDSVLALAVAPSRLLIAAGRRVQVVWFGREETAVARRTPSPSSAMLLRLRRDPATCSGW